MTFVVKALFRNYLENYFLAQTRRVNQQFTAGSPRVQNTQMEYRGIRMNLKSKRKESGKTHLFFSC